MSHQGDRYAAYITIVINYCRLEKCTKLYLDYNIFTSAHWTVSNPAAGSDLMDATKTDIFISHLSAVLCLTIRCSECCADVTPDCGAEVFCAVDISTS